MADKIPDLDLKDRKILFELEQDSRQSLSQIAKKVLLKKETVFHRIKRLEKAGIIKKYVAEIDVYKLGYFFCPVLLKFQDTKPDVEEEIINYLKKSKYVGWLTTCEGDWNVNLTLVLKNIFEMEQFLSAVSERYGNFIAQKQTFVTTEVHYFKRGYWLDKETTETISTGKTEAVKIGKDEIKLLRALSENARLSMVEIATKIDTNPKAVAYRIKKLEKEKIIQGSKILVDFSKIGYNFYKVWFGLKNMDKEKWKKLLTYLHYQPNILWATKIIGKYELSIEMEVKDVNEFRQIVNKIKENFSEIIREHESLLILEEHVLNYLPYVKNS